MSDRILCDCTKSSPTLPLLSRTAFGLYAFIFQETDDYGCFDTDPEVVKGHRFPKIKWVTAKMIEHCLQEYNRLGSLFLWTEDRHRYGFFVGFELKSGRHLSKRRKRETPEPPSDLLAKFLQDNNRFQSLPTTSNDFLKGKESKGKEIKGNNNKTFVELFNSTCPSFPQVRSLSKGREAKIGLRLKEHPDFAWWREVFAKMESTPFLKGQNKRQWRASFDWLIDNDRNAIKVQEGNYEKGQGQRTWDK